MRDNSPSHANKNDLICRQYRDNHIKGHQHRRVGLRIRRHRHLIGGCPCFQPRPLNVDSNPLRQRTPQLRRKPPQAIVMLVSVIFRIRTNRIGEAMAADHLPPSVNELLSNVSIPASVTTCLFLLMTDAISSSFQTILS